MKSGCYNFFLTVLALCTCANLSARQWTLKDGDVVEGEVLRCTSKILTLKTPEKKSVLVELSKLSDADIELLRENYKGVYVESGNKSSKPRGLEAGASKKADNLKSEEVSENSSVAQTSSASSLYPNVKLSIDKIGLVMGSGAGGFSTKHFSFNMKSPIENDEARDMALQAEIVYEAVMSFNFIPQDAKRFSTQTTANKKFPIEIGNMKIANSIGVYSYSFDKSGEIKSEKVTILPKYAKYCKELLKTDLRLPIGVFAHEITHMLLASAHVSCALSEGVAVYCELAFFSKDGQLNFEDIDGFLKSPDFATGFNKYCGRPPSKEMFKEVSSTLWRYHYIKTNKIKYAGGLKKFLNLPQKSFTSSARAANNYNGAFLLYHYFIKTNPELLKNYISAQSGYQLGKEKKLKESFEILLDGKKEAELEADIVEFYKDYGITVEF